MPGSPVSIGCTVIVTPGAAGAPYTGTIVGIFPPVITANGISMGGPYRDVAERLARIGRKPRLQVMTRGGHQVVLDDNNGTIVLETAGGHRVTLNQQDGSLSIASQGAIRLKAGTDINVSAGNKISITAGSQVNVRGLPIKLNDP